MLPIPPKISQKVNDAVLQRSLEAVFKTKVSTPCSTIFEFLNALQVELPRDVDLPVSLARVDVVREKGPVIAGIISFTPASWIYRAVTEYPDYPLLACDSIIGGADGVFLLRRVPKGDIDVHGTGISRWVEAMKRPELYMNSHRGVTVMAAPLRSFV